MTWLRIEDGFVEHPKVIDLSDRAFRLHMAALCHCARNLTDGFLSERALRVTCALTSASRKHVVELRDVGLWLQLETGWEIKDFLDYNPDAQTVKELREKRREAGRIGGERSGEARRQANAQANASSFASSKRPSNRVQPRPVPNPELRALHVAVASDEAESPTFEAPKDIVKEMP